MGLNSNVKRVGVFSVIVNCKGQLNTERNFAECRNAGAVWLSVIMPSINILSVLSLY